MDVRKISNAAEARALVESTGARHIKVGVFDMDGVLRGKYMHRDKFLSALEDGFGFCDVVLGWSMGLEDEWFGSVSGMDARLGGCSPTVGGCSPRGAARLGGCSPGGLLAQGAARAH